MRNRCIRRCAVFVLLSAGISLVSAQSNQRLDELLAQEPAETGYAAYLVLTAADIVAEDSSPEAAYRSAVDAGWIAPESSPSQPIDFGLFSYLFMEAFDVPGGVMYRIFPGPRYAAREVVYQEWSRTRRSPGELLSGDATVRILSVFLNERGGVQ
ncbi:MAG: hypothetical protein PF508_02070 [Spirochaeta sp.]|jgi:hypothetical protein|nr:hypothetical protein [Spirochaeta sp.]